jgi:hypothetical protein
MAGDGHKIRDIIIDSGSIYPITNLLDRATPGSSFVRNASWCLSNFCRGKPGPALNKI